MPIHNLGYREWSGRLTSAGSRWWVIASIGIRRAWQSMWLRRIVFFAWVPGVLMALLIYLFEQAAVDGNAATYVRFNGLVSMLLGRGERQLLSDAIESSGTAAQNLFRYRHQFWCSLLQVLYQRSQAMVLIPVIGITAPPLISQDMRSRAFLLYFSRPISRSQYILGKAATIACYVMLISFLPGILLYITGVLLSPDITIVADTWDIPLRIVAATAVMVIPATSLGLMLSSLTTETRFASFAWFSVWIFGMCARLVTASFAGPGSRTPLEMLSLFHVVSDVQGWLLEPITAARQDVTGPAAVLVVITVVSLSILYRRVSAPMNV